MARGIVFSDGEFEECADGVYPGYLKFFAESGEGFIEVVVNLSYM